MKASAEEREKQLERAVEQREYLVKDALDAEDDFDFEPSERTHLVDYLPVFEDGDVEFDDINYVKVDEPVEDGEGDYDQLDVKYSSSDGEYDVVASQYEEVEDAEDKVEDFENSQEEVLFTENGDARTVDFTGYSGELKKADFSYDDDDAVADVDEEDIESVSVDGEDITDRVEQVSTPDGEQLRINFENGYYVNQGETVSVTYSDAGEGELEDVQVNNEGNTFEYDEDDNERKDIYRDGDTVVEITGNEKDGDEHDFNSQYEDLQSQYE